MSPRARILLVEDDDNEVDVTLRALRRAGFEREVAVVRDGQAALEALGLEKADSSRAPLRPSVVFLDLKLPRVSGWEVLRRLREHPDTAVLPVVVVSTSDEREDMQRSYELGANSFLVKHYDPRGPGRYLAEAAYYWLEMNQAPPRGGTER